MAELATPTRRLIQLNPQRFKGSEFARHDYVVDAEEGTKLEDITNPAYWAHCAPQLAPMDRIDVRLETGEWLAELLVVRCDRNWAAVKLLHHYDLTEVVNSSDTPSTPHLIKFGGNHHKWRVIRKADSEPIMSGLETKEAAEAWLRNYESNTLRT